MLREINWENNTMDRGKRLKMNQKSAKKIYRICSWIMSVCKMIYKKLLQNMKKLLKN